MPAILEDGRLTLIGDVGDFGWGEYFSHSDVVLALAQIEDDADLEVVINSGGGFATDGAAIYALLSRRAGATNVTVDGIAASAASLIAMAGDTVTMSAGSVLMIHDPAGFTMGNAEDHAKTIEGLEALATSYARVYAERTGKTSDECRAIMKAERWFSPDEAVTEGFADATSEKKAQAVAAFDYRAYQHAPQKLVALARKKNWRLPDAAQRADASAAAPPRQQENPMTANPVADDVAANTDIEKAKREAAAAAVTAYRDRRKAVLALDEAKGREALAEHLVESTDMSVDAVKAVLAAAPKAEAKAGDDEADYERQRLNGEGLSGGQRDRPKAKGDLGILAAAVARTNKRR